tara:strand:- start:630 stop:785 length:156 start_codon:yes stop_codon:yes gene_type:complete
MAKKSEKVVEETKAPVEEAPKAEEAKADYVEELRPDGRMMRRYKDGRVIPV